MEFRPTLHKLSSGITVILDPMDLETVAVKINFATGSRDETPDIHGITHFCEHMLMKGTPSHPNTQALKNYIENKGGTYNASTSPQRLQIHGRIIAENTDVLLETFADMLKNSLFDEHRIEIERNLILDESRRAHSDNKRRYGDLIYTNLLGFSLYRNLGPDENIKSFTRAQLLDWVHKRLSAKNCTICVSGRIDDSAALLKKIEDLFNFLPTHDVKTNSDLKYTPCDKFMHEPSIKNVWIDILFPFIRPDTFENLRENIAESKFHKYLGQELAEVVRQQNGLVYGIGVTAYGNEFYGIQGIHTETSPENLERAVALIAATAYRVYNRDKITSEIIERFFNIHKLNNADFLESASSRCNVLVNNWVDFGVLYDYYARNEIDKSITAGDVITASTGIFDGPMSIITFGAEYDADLRKIWIDNFK